MLLLEGENVEESLKYTFLLIIKNNSNIWNLIEQGYQIGQVFTFLDILQNDGYIGYDDNKKVCLSEKAIEFISNYQANNNINNVERFILPRNEMWSKPIKETDIYIPRK